MVLPHSNILKTHNFLILRFRWRRLFTYCFLSSELVSFQTELNAFKFSATMFFYPLRGITAFFQIRFKQILSLFYCSWDSKVVDLFLLKFTVKFGHCPRFTMPFHSTKFSFSLVFYKGSNFALRKRKWSKWMKVQNLHLT